MEKHPGCAPLAPPGTPQGHSCLQLLAASRHSQQGTFVELLSRSDAAKGGKTNCGEACEEHVWEADPDHKQKLQKLPERRSRLGRWTRRRVKLCWRQL